MTMTSPLVSIGMPVHNGSSLLREALQQIIEQTYKNLEIIISNNNSSDETHDICKSFAEKDSRIKYYHQQQTLTAWENFKFVLTKSHGEYFAWAAHDDRHSLNYIEILTNALEKNSKACLAFTDFSLFNSHNKFTPEMQESYRYYQGEKCTSIRKSFKKMVHCIHTYGLMRTEKIKSYSFIDIDYGGDLSFIAYMSFRGDFLYVEGGMFYYFEPSVPKNPKDRALEVSLKKLKPLPRVRIAWHTARNICEAQYLEGKHCLPLLILPLTLWIWLKPAIYESSPSFFRKVWKKFKYTIS